MSKLAEYKALEARLAEQLKQLDALKNDDELKSEIEFEEKLRKLMAEYDVNLRSVIALLDPEASRGAVSVGRGGARRQRQVKVYKNPNTGEVVETKGGNHRVLKAWKEQYGAEAVDSWIQ
ncbi:MULTISPECIES: histone-like nucleoid-structuring protein, MvaT/MvaU family [unclassified Pseudomonas]|uniref:histone-like nucleoid-structuring protein, MvaT/MvaU family n=1 Tax=unclassified Pseudomonas TaxID=196821 RepID=UPI0024472BA0|nr:MULTISPECIES: histone-like nucleoid-structuring protein, MvaT/MvaU family [unclassified Pseudomonas]MDH0894862.1 DNA binding protein [Pseudomonas sp. GD03875]MDH1063940.1 DNA binding protein [Pseudomonas sp. GD03985]